MDDRHDRAMVLSFAQSTMQMAFLWLCNATNDALPENNNMKSVLIINVPTSSKYGDLDNHQCNTNTE